MSIQFNSLTALLFVLIACSSVFGQAEAKRQIDPGVAKLGKGFVSKTAHVHGTTLHYVRGGTGPAVVLLHGFPQDWYEFHQIMPRLATKFTVIAVDLRGVGGSAAPLDGYDAAHLAEDVHQLAQQLRLERPYIASHDIGGMVAYAYARRAMGRSQGQSRSLAYRFSPNARLARKVNCRSAICVFPRSFQSLHSKQQINHRRRRYSLCQVLRCSSTTACRHGVLSRVSRQRAI
jgi:pimeloyl-ACP methyl ester carboxylesterase